MAKHPTYITLKGKGTRQQILPHRGALNTLTRGDPAQRSMGHYGKATPSMEDSPSVPQMALMGPRP
jgi:hypothetical protein